ncbi:MAG TPA: MFS transporter [Microvirga sp.]
MKPLPAPALPWGFVASLSLAQLVSWGCLFYAFALFLTPMSAELGWSKAQLTAAYSVGLATSAVGAVPAGRLIDLGHGRWVMTGGSLMASALLALWSVVDGYPAFLLIWAGLGLTMSAVLYDPGFAVLSRRLGGEARRGIVVMTLVGGLASTVFIPLTHGLIEGFGWRPALMALAVLNLGFAALIHWLAIPARQAGTSRAGERIGVEPSNARRVLRQAAFWGFVACVLLQGIVSTGLPVHFIPLWLERGFTLDAIVAAYAVIGPAQVGARLLVGLLEGWWGIRAVGLLTLGLGLASVVLIPFVAAGSWLIVGFAVLYGASNGMMTILRALLPAELFGRADYGAILGMIAAPTNLTKAAAPFAFGALLGWWGSYEGVVLLSIGLSAAALLAFLVTIASAGAGLPGAAKSG